MATETTPQQHEKNSEEPMQDGDAQAEGGTLRRVKNKVERALHLGPNRRHRANSTTVASINRARSRFRHERTSGDHALSDASDESDGDSPDAESGSDAESEIHDERRVDPSTNLDPAQAEGKGGQAEEGVADPESAAAQEATMRKGKKKKNKDVSKHTFFVSNSQMRLKLFAKNEVS